MAPKRKTAPKPEPFLRRVEEALLRVPAGRVVTYGQLALLAGRPRAARAVGMLMAQNPYGELLLQTLLIGEALGPALPGQLVDALDDRIHRHRPPFG